MRAITTNWTSSVEAAASRRERQRRKSRSAFSAPATPSKHGQSYDDMDGEDRNVWKPASSSLGDVSDT
jgi:hypothetical protein